MNRPPSSWVLTEGYAGLRSQALGLAEAAGLSPAVKALTPSAPWGWIPPALWPRPLAAVRMAAPPPFPDSWPDSFPDSFPDLAIACGGMGAAIGAALRRRGTRVVQVQHPRMNPRHFDVIVVNRHDELTGPNVVVTRTAMHQVTTGKLTAAADQWRARLATLPRPLVSVLLGGSNGRFRLNRAGGVALAGDLANMMRRDGAGVAITPSRRTDPAALAAIQKTLAPLGAWLWDGTGDNPYFALLALADAIVVTIDSISMISESVATCAPVMLAPLPGRSRRNGLFVQPLLAEGRVRRFTGRLETWSATPINDTPQAAAEVRRRLGF